MPADAPGNYFVARLRGEDVAAVGSHTRRAPPTPAWSSYVWVDSADDAAAAVTAAGGQVLGEPFDVLGAGRMAVLADRSGAAICVWQAGEHRGAELVNEPGSWNFSDLYTRDPDGARAFYGECSAGRRAAWDRTARSSASGDGPATGISSSSGPRGCMRGWTRWERRRVRRRDRLHRADDRRRFGEDAPAHWGVTFAVEDADATAERRSWEARSSPPFDAPWVRTTVLRDPQGACSRRASSCLPVGRPTELEVA